MDIRKLNRLYLLHFHLLAQKYLTTEFSMAEARILHEIYESEENCVRDIAGNLQVDKSYLSRILKKLESQALLERKPSSDGSRLILISLTEKGKLLAANLISDPTHQVEKSITGLSDRDLEELSHHLERVLEIWGKCQK